MHLFLHHESDETDEASKKEVQIIVVKFSNYSTDHADRVSCENRVNMAEFNLLETIKIESNVTGRNTKSVKVKSHKLIPVTQIHSFTLSRCK